jgi:plastocyanin
VTARPVFLPLLAAALLLGGCSSGGTGGAPFAVPGTPVATNQVDLPKSLKYVPAVIEVPVGTTVTWTNHDTMPHTVRLLDGGDVNKPLAVGGSTTITFTRAATIYYDCSIHPQMHGKVVVSP